MTHHESHKHHKKLKKLQQLLKNRHTRDINLQADEHARGRDLEKEREEEVKAAGTRAAQKKSQGSNPVWSAKMQEIRDRNTGRTRMATERWNRFAGTGESGGRGL